jgi:hypothetical protein
MTTEQGATRRTRRAVLGAALGGAAAVAAGSLKPLGVRAADGGNAIIGQANQSNATTIFENLDPSETSLAGISGVAGVGVLGDSKGNIGVHGTSDVTAGVRGSSVASAGVWGTSGDTDLAPTLDPGETGVYGYSNTSNAANGVWGESPDGAGVYGSGNNWGVYGFAAISVQGDAGPGGVGVYGWTGEDAPPVPPLGVGVYARAETITQTALQVVGRFMFNRAGYKDITRSSTTFSVAGVTSKSQVFVVLQTSVSGLYVRAVKPLSGKFTVYLSKSPGKKVRISYIVING